MSKRKKIAIAGGGILVLALIVFFSINATRKDSISVQTAKAERRDSLTAKVSASGEIRAKEFVDLQSEIAGLITELPVHEGDRVEKGAVLLRIDPIQTAADTSSARAQHEAAVAESRAQQFQILNAEAGLARDEASLNSARAELEQAQNNFTRSQNSFTRKQQLHEDGLISREEYEMAQNEARGSKAQLEVAKARVSQMQTQVDIARNNIQQMKSSQTASLSRAKSVAANLTRAQDQLKKTTLYAPLSGVITQLLVEEGERAVPGIMSNPQATLMTIADLSTIQAELKVDETDVVNVAIGNKAFVKVDALPEVSMEGEVTEVGNSPINSAAAAQQQEAKDFKVIVTIKNPSPKLRPGMSCTGDILTDTRQNVLVVPIQALTIREVEVDASGTYHEPQLGNQPAKQNVANNKGPKAKKKELEGLFVIRDRVARFRPVKAGIAGDSEIEIREGLKDGEEVVSGSFQTLRTIKDGASVKIDKNVKQGNKT
jgi:HlyD family secretion protein